jgi:hypothetical protein
MGAGEIVRSRKAVHCRRAEYTAGFDVQSGLIANRAFDDTQRYDLASYLNVCCLERMLSYELFPQTGFR